MRVRTGRFRSVSPAGGRIDEMPDWITARSWLNPLMLPAFAALRGRRPVGPFVHPVRQGVRGFLFGSVLHGTQVFRSLRFHGRYFAPGLPATTMTSADSSSPSPGIISRRGRSAGRPPRVRTCCFSAQPRALPPTLNSGLRWGVPAHPCRRPDSTFLSVGSRI